MIPCSDSPLPNQRKFYTIVHQNGEQRNRFSYGGRIHFSLQPQQRHVYAVSYMSLVVEDRFPQQLLRAADTAWQGQTFILKLFKLRQLAFEDLRWVREREAFSETAPCSRRVIHKGTYSKKVPAFAVSDVDDSCMII